MKTATDVSAALRATLEGHLPAQLAALTRPLPVPSTFAEVPTDDMVRRVRDVSLAISVPGLTAAPVLNAEGLWAVTFAAVIVVIHRDTPASPFPAATNDYGFAVAATLQQNPSLGGFADWTRWTGWTADPRGDAISNGVLGQSASEFSVHVSGVIDESAAPGPSFGFVELVDVTTNPQ